MQEPETHSGAAPVAARGLSRRYGPIRALDGVDLDLAPGEFLTIFGPNGAGKTTLLRILSSLVRPTAGSLSIFGLDPKSAADPVKRRIGLIGHNGFLYGGLTARDNLRFYGRLYDLPDIPERCEALLEEVGLAERAEDQVRTFSRGMQQRLSIARALIHDPDLVLLDEPYTGLDQHASRTLRGILEQVRGRGRSVVMVTHHLDEGLEVSTRVSIMARGRFAFEAPTRGLSHAGMQRVYHDVVGDGA